MSPSPKLRRPKEVGGSDFSYFYVFFRNPGGEFVKRDVLFLYFVGGIYFSWTGQTFNHGHWIRKNLGKGRGTKLAGSGWEGTILPRGTFSLGLGGKFGSFLLGFSNSLVKKRIPWVPLTRDIWG